MSVYLPPFNHFPNKVFNNEDKNINLGIFCYKFDIVCILKYPEQL